MIPIAPCPRIFHRAVDGLAFSTLEPDGLYRHFGLDVEVRASRYIALWDGDSKALRESLERIAKTARALIDDLNTVANRKAVA